MVGFWTPEIMAERLPDLIDGFDVERISHSSYELCMGDEAYVTRVESKPRTKMSLRVSDRVVIPPGQFALLLTAETVSVPPDILGFISIKFNIKRRGLINVSGFHVDPGFEGKLLFSVYNAGPKDIVISKGAPTFLLWLCSLEQPTGHVYGSKDFPGSRQKQDHISDDDVIAIRGEVFSPQALGERLKRLETRVRWIVAGIVFFLTLVVVPIVTGLIVNNTDSISDWFGRIF